MSTHRNGSKRPLPVQAEPERDEIKLMFVESKHMNGNKKNCPPSVRILHDTLNTEGIGRSGWGLAETAQGRGGGSGKDEGKE